MTPHFEPTTQRAFTSAPASIARYPSRQRREGLAPVQSYDGLSRLDLQRLVAEMIG